MFELKKEDISSLANELIDFSCRAGRSMGRDVFCIRCSGDLSLSETRLLGLITTLAQCRSDPFSVTVRISACGAVRLQVSLQTVGNCIAPTNGSGEVSC